MQSEEIRKYVTQIIEDKNLQGVEQDIKDKLIEDLGVRLEDQINRALINELSEEQTQEFIDIVKANETEKLKTFFQEKGVNVQGVVANTMVRFRENYLKAK